MNISTEPKSVLRTFYYLIDEKGTRYFYSHKPSPHFQMKIVCKVRAYFSKAPSGCIVHQNDEKPIVGHCYCTTSGKIIEIVSISPSQA